MFNVYVLENRSQESLMCNSHSIYISILKCEWLLVSSRLHTTPTLQEGLGSKLASAGADRTFSKILTL